MSVCDIIGGSGRQEDSDSLEKNPRIMAEDASTTRSRKAFKGTEDDYTESGMSHEDIKEEVNRKHEEKMSEIGAYLTNTQRSTMEIMMQFMALQEQKREDEKERYKRESKEERARYEEERKEEREHYKRERREEQERYERERIEERVQRERLEQQRKEEPQRLENAMKLKEVNITKLNPTDDIENYLTTFERTATTFEWPKEKWVVKLAPYLTGKAEAAYAAMSSTESNDYDKVKEAILKRYDITEKNIQTKI